MTPSTSRARQLATIAGLIRAGGQFCIVCVVVTGCMVGGWRFAGSEIADKFIQGMVIARDASIAQAEASKANAAAIELAARIVDRAGDILDLPRVNHTPRLSEKP